MQIPAVAMKSLAGRIRRLPLVANEGTGRAVLALGQLMEQVPRGKARRRTRGWWHVGSASARKCGAMLVAA